MQSTFNIAEKYTSPLLAARIWFLTSVIFSAILVITLFFKSPSESIILMSVMAFVVSLIASIPVLIILLIAIPIIKRQNLTVFYKIIILLVLEMFCVSVYLIPATIFGLISESVLIHELYALSILPISALLASGISYKYIVTLFSTGNPNYVINSHKKYNTMEAQPALVHSGQSNSILIKGFIIGGLILLMLIPALLVSNLVSERELRHKQVVQEVSAKWATAQTVAGPFLVVPYIENGITTDGKKVVVKKKLVVLSKDMHVNGQIFPENRSRSIYKVLLYKSNLDINGTFQPQWPVDLDLTTLDLANSKLCFGLSDFKGIQEEIFINFNKQKVAFAPGIPDNLIAETGLSIPVNISMDSLNAGIPYAMNVKLKGSERLHFMPLSANSSFALSSTWSSPSFDGNALPDNPTIGSNGFNAKWKYNQANLPFGTVIRNNNFLKQELSFGVSLVQPADHYNKTMRSIKYAILIIGLTFALFFIIELMQRKPFHPVQYVLVGLALVIFYTLLLAISEYVVFDQAYLIAAAATIILICLYAKSHFNSWKTSLVFGTALSILYGFIFILLRLEDTALLVGSIGLFIVLALVMFVSRKINWYGNKRTEPAVLST